jgi:hypothetical protein
MAVPASGVRGVPPGLPGRAHAAAIDKMRKNVAVAECRVTLALAGFGAWSGRR